MSYVRILVAAVQWGQFNEKQCMYIGTRLPIAPDANYPSNYSKKSQYFHLAQGRNMTIA